jgi:hypothetical protein
MTLGILTYRMGRIRGEAMVHLQSRAEGSALAVTQESLDRVRRERDGANVQIADRDVAITELRRERERSFAELRRLKASQSALSIRLQRDENENEELREERDTLAQRVATQQAALRDVETKLNALEARHSEESARTTGLEARIEELSRLNEDHEKTIEEERDLLTKDQDIRELMGARDLYVTEVYTKGKSLIFYAYDLDGAPGWKKANSFQAWGMHGADRSQSFNLGMFYEDNVSKKRWVLKFDDRKTLRQIDAVFVTIEPRGGSERPSGKPFLYAYLKMGANHP